MFSSTYYQSVMIAVAKVPLSFSVLSNWGTLFLAQPFMGDNYCDAINNRAFCNYDGGDCCQSTVKTKKVCCMLVPQNKRHTSEKGMILDLVLATLVNSHCLFPNFGVTHSLGINLVPTCENFSLFPEPYSLGCHFLCQASVYVTCCFYRVLTFINNHVSYKNERTE